VYYYDDYIDEEGNLIYKDVEEPPENPGCGYNDFISKEELWRRRETLLKDDSLAVRCDVSILYFDTLYGGA
jgi:speckle-type POZ protein